MTFKQQKFLEELPKNNFSVKKSAEKACYSPSYASSDIYRNIRKPQNAVAKVLQRWTAENTMIEIERAMKKMKKNGDNTNYVRLLELRSKILGLQKDIRENRHHIIEHTDAEYEELRGIRNRLAYKI